jgi:hypothetical protein
LIHAATCTSYTALVMFPMGATATARDRGYCQMVAGGPLVPLFDREAVSLGEVLARQVELLHEAHRRQDRVAAQVLRGTGAARGPDEELFGSQLSAELARHAIARDHGYAGWAAAREHSHLMVDTRFEAAADAIQWGDLAALRDLLDRLAMTPPFGSTMTA